MQYRYCIATAVAVQKAFLHSRFADCSINHKYGCHSFICFWSAHQWRVAGYIFFASKEKLSILISYFRLTTFSNGFVPIFLQLYFCSLTNKPFSFSLIHLGSTNRAALTSSASSNTNLCVETSKPLGPSAVAKNKTLS